MYRPYCAADWLRPSPASARTIALVCALCASSCVAPPLVALEGGGIPTEVESRLDLAYLEDTLEANGLDRPGLTVPVLEERSDPAQAGYWTARALVWAPGVRAARRTWRAALGLADAAGAPNPAQIQVVDHQLGGDDKLIEGIGVFDVFGLLGIGPSGAELRSANAAAAMALGTLEREVWQATLAAEAARIRCIAAHARVASVRLLMDDASADLERIAILDRHGRVGAAAVEASTAAVELLKRRLSVELDQATQSRAELIRQTGVHVDDPALDVFAALDNKTERLVRTGERLEVGPTTDTETHPVLREAHLGFALAEARVREAAAASWPRLGLGPHLGYLDQARLGAVLRLSIPSPSRWRGELTAAVERRDGAIEAYEDAHHHLAAHEADARARLQSARERLEGPTRTIDAATQSRWNATRVAFGMARSSVAEWMDALAARSSAVTLEVDDAEALAMAALEVRTACGPCAASGASTSIMHRPAEAQP